MGLFKRKFSSMEVTVTEAQGTLPSFLKRQIQDAQQALKQGDFNHVDGVLQEILDANVLNVDGREVAVRLGDIRLIVSLTKDGFVEVRTQGKVEHVTTEATKNGGMMRVRL